ASGSVSMRASSTKSTPSPGTSVGRQAGPVTRNQCTARPGRWAAQLAASTVLPEPAGALTSSTRPLPQPPFSASTAASTASNSNGLAIGVNEGSGALGNPDRPGWCEVLTAPCLFGAFVPSRLSCHDAKKLDPPQHALRRPNLPDRCVFPVRARCSCYSNFTATVRQR